MDLYQKLSQVVRNKSVGDFVRLHNRLYLYGTLPESSAFMGFGTFVTGPTLGDFTARGTARRRAVTFVESIEKSGRNDWKRRISVGRSSNNDIIFRHESVSKLHAYFFVRVRRKGLKRAEELVLSDASSSNGTQVNGRGVSADPEQAVVVKYGDRIAFGEVDCEFCDTATLYKYLKRQDRLDF